MQTFLKVDNFILFLFDARYIICLFSVFFFLTKKLSKETEMNGGNVWKNWFFYFFHFNAEMSHRLYDSMPCLKTVIFEANFYINLLTM